ncbi:MAG: YfhO family protein [Bryobacteraceae bacterium]
MRKLAAPAILFLLCVSFYWRLTLTGQYTFLDSPDLSNLDLPRLQFQASAWRHSHLPLWDPYQWVGQPFLGQVTGAAYPANWLLGAFPFREGKLSVTVIHWYFVLIHFQAALFCYFLCRDLKRSQAASILGGLVFSLGGFLGATEWPQILNGALWIPLVFLFLFRALRGRRALFSAAMSGALLGVSWLSGHHEVPIYATTVVAGVWIAALARGPGRAAILRLGLAAALATGLIAAIQILPALEYAPLAKRWVGQEGGPVGGNERIPYSVHQHYSWSPAAAIGIVTPRPPLHIDPFIGIVAFSLALLGIYHGWPRLPQVRVLVSLAAAGLLFAMAAANFIHGVLYSAIPVFGMARVPARALVIFGFAIAPLTAYGLDALGRRASPWLARTIFALVAIAALLYAAVAGGLRPALAHDPVMLTALTAILGATLFTAFRAHAISMRFALCAVPLLILVEIGNVSGANLASRIAVSRPGYLERLFHHNDIAGFLRAQPQPIRIDVSVADIPYNFGDWHGIATLGGFAASATTNLLELEWHKPRVQDLLGINYYIGAKPARPDLERLTDGVSGLNVYRNPSALPRAWIVHIATQVPSYAVIRSRLDSPEFQPRKEALLLTSPPALESCSAAEEAKVAHSENPNRVRIDVKLACRGMVILSDTYFPGWHAAVDGRSAAILQPFGALRGIVVEKGDHRIELVYRPASAVTGASLTVIGVLFVFWTRWQTGKQRAR